MRGTGGKMRLAKLLLWLVVALLIGWESMGIQPAMADKVASMAPPGDVTEESGGGFIGGQGAPERQLLAAGEQPPAPMDPTTTRPGPSPAKPDATGPVQTTG